MALDIKQRLYGIPGAGIETYFAKFTNANLVANVLYVNHKINQSYPAVAVYDNTDKQIIPDEIVGPLVGGAVTGNNPNRISIDLTSFSPIVGIWKVRVVGG